ncbi:DEAD/DEAH box helicase [Helcococcus ovis]|uniref:DEAD/DEAH box helicase n=1 Tax=Helcococcus ovis TaxID=72026 RepID=UPI0038BCC77B
MLHSLIICPASLVLNWESEFSKFSDINELLVIHGNKESRIEKISSIKNEIVITSYDYTKRDIDLYKEIEFDTFIIDEAQYIKNYKTKVTKAVKQIISEYKIALTGTPIENTLSELWSIFDFLMRGYLFKYEKFSNLLEKPIVLNNDENCKEKLKSMVEPFILRRLKSEVLNELPQKIEETYYVEQSEEEKKIYLSNLMMVNKAISSKEDNNKIEILAMLTKLRQICIDPRLLYESVTDVSSKIKVSIELIQKSIENKEKVILFSNFTSVLDLLSQELNKINIDYYTLTGSTNKIMRKKLVDDFQSDDTPVFLISLKAGGTGLNLTKASVVIHIDPWWNLSAQNQATDRAYRIGQKNVVQVFNLITKDTIEEKIQKLQLSKKDLSDIFIENSKGSFANMSKEDLLELFKY